ncbi:MAG: hypothetical protein ABI894_01575 [Ilumatobacteraceae bacterium]
MKSTLLLPLILVALTIPSCGSDDPSTTDSGATSSSSVDGSGVTSSSASGTTSTTTPVTTAASTSTTTSSTSTTTSTSTTSTTVAPGAELVLRANGLGDAAFGADPEGVIAYVTSIIGQPTVDTGWVDPLSIGACPGTEFRQVYWADLTLQFSDDSAVTSGRRHFFSYVYGPSFVQGQPIAPAGLKTEAGVGVGSTVAELTGTYPTAVVSPGDDFGGPHFSINDSLFGFLTGVNPTDTVTSILGGQGCGE